MLFNSLEFIYGFVPLTLCLFYLSGRFHLVKLSQAILLIMSLAFYGYWKLFFFILILFKIITNYWISLYLEKKPSKWAFTLSIIFNLGFLAYFKYYNFFLDIAESIFPFSAFHPQVTIPLGISFYTFTQITYLTDLYKKKTRVYGLVPYSLFVVFFPHLIAGPIVHYSKLMPQFNRVKTYLFQPKNIFLGLFYFLFGLFQKVVIADSLISLSDLGFGNAHLLSMVEAWGSVLAYSLQIYFDFAGYSNMAIGLALLFNIRFPVNFDSPYQSLSLIDFWRRWHITLSQFLRDSIYIPLGGNRFGWKQKYASLFLTMLIGGLWHGAGWTFILWGAYHGILLIANHSLNERKVVISYFAARLGTFLLVCYGWVFFRSESFRQALDITQALAGLNGTPLKDTFFFWKYQFILMTGILAIALAAPNMEWWAKKVKPNWQWGIVFTFVFVTNLFFLNQESAFLYFQF